MLSLLLGLACKPSEAPGNPEITCASGELVDGDACVPASCGVGAWGDAEADAAVFVQAGASEPGDGSRESPFPSIQAGADAASEAGGGLVAIAGGTYSEALVLGEHHDGVRLAGRCRELVIVDAATLGESVSALWLTEAGTGEVGASGMTFRGARAFGIDVDSGTLALTSVDVVANERVGVNVHGQRAEVEGEDVRILDTVPTGPDSGAGVQVYERGELSLSRSLLEGNTFVGVLVSDGIVTLSDSRIAGTFPYDGDDGYGLFAQGGAEVILERVEVDGNSDAGLMAAHAGTTLTVTDTLVTGTGSPDGERYGRGVWVDGATAMLTRVTVSGSFADGLYLAYGAQVTGSDLTVSGNASTGVYVAEEGTVVDLDGVDVLDTRTDGDGVHGEAVFVWNGATATLSSCTFAGNHDAAAVVDGAALTLRSCDVEGAFPVDAGTDGQGVFAQFGANVVLEDVEIHDATEVGLFVGAAGTTARLTRVTVRDGLPGVDGLTGIGVIVQDGASLEADALFVTDNRDVGVYTYGEGTYARIVRSEIAGTAITGLSDWGRGLEAIDGAVVEGEDLDVVGNRELAVYVNAATLSLVGGEIRDTTRSPALGWAAAIVGQDGATVSLTDVDVTGVEGPALYVADAEVVVSGGTFSEYAFAGAVVYLGDLVATDAVFAGAAGDGDLLGVYASDRAGTPAIELDGVTVAAHTYAGVWLEGAGAYVLSGCDLAGSEGVESHERVVHGNAVFANGVGPWTGTEGLLIEGSSLHDSPSAAVLLHEGSGTFAGNTWAGNDADVAQQAAETWPAATFDGDAAGFTLVRPPAGYTNVLPVDFSMYLLDREAGVD
ncbi:MAG: right-handed parallel beta-helix repeat-containing protein [Myxococcota bacterium]